LCHNTLVYTTIQNANNSPHKMFIKINTTQQQSVSNDMNSIGYSGLISGHNDVPVTR